MDRKGSCTKPASLEWRETLSKRKFQSEEVQSDG